MADGIKFLPSFANSPAGKLALGTSGMGMGSSPGQGNSPPAMGGSVRRSPGSRFGMTGGER